MNRFNLTPQSKRAAFNLCVAALTAITILLLLGSFMQTAAAQNEHHSGVSETDTVYVSPPTGEKETDRASILAAFEEVKPGGTVQFAPGRYLIGPMIRLAADEITLLGHPGGTVIRGCEPDDFPGIPAALFACHGFELAGARQTVRNLTFEYTWHGLYVGCCFPETPEEMEGGNSPPRSQPGGHLIEGNTFRYTPNGLRVIGEGAEPTVVRNNRFIDVYHAIGINGGPVHFLDNEMSVKHPERVPTSTHPGDVINVTTYSTILPTPVEDHTSCRNNRIENNRIEGYPDGIRIVVYHPGTSCRNNVIRNNTIKVDRVRFAENWHGIRRISETDSTVVGIPLRLSNLVMADSSMDHSAGYAVIEDNLIEGNRVIGGEGLGMEILHASGNRIVNNIFTDIRRRYPFPGNTLGGDPGRWHQANGSGIWLSPGSNRNEILNNTFKEIASADVFIEGDSNLVELSNLGSEVKDLGIGNLINVRVTKEGLNVSGDEGNYLSATQLKRRAALIYIQHAGFSLVDARERGLSPTEQGRRIGEIIARNKRRLNWNTSSNALLANALAKLIEPEFELEFAWATLTLRSRYERAAQELVRYGSSIEEYINWLHGMHSLIGPVQGYSMTARIEGDWFVETYSDLPNRNELEPISDLPLYEPSAEKLGRYEGVYTGTRLGDPLSVEYNMRVWQEDGHLRITTWQMGHREPHGRHLVPVAEGIFFPGWYPSEGPVEVSQNAHVRFSPTDTGFAKWSELEVKTDDGAVLWRLQRTR